MIAVDLLPSQIQNHWHLLPQDVQAILGSPAVDLGNTWVCFNVQNIDRIKIPADATNVVITYHTEYIRHREIRQFFKQHADRRFLFLSDWLVEAPGFFGSNVTSLRWLTWHHQLQNIMSHHGICRHVIKPTKKISCLSYRHEFHKAAVTAYIQKHFDDDNSLWSWWNIKDAARMYYLEPEFYIPENIAKYVLDAEFQATVRVLDQFSDSPILQSDWHHPAYVDCLFNCTNESIYNDLTMLDNVLHKLPAPYLTDKTWKPLLSGRPMIPVSQNGSLQALSDLGMKFVPEVMAVDHSASEFCRIAEIWQKLDWILQTSIENLFDYTFESVNHNIHWIADGGFFKSCEQQNQPIIGCIMQWNL